MAGYGQFCPVAVASEVLAERWTPLVIRELVCGSKRFNDLRRGVPTMSPSLLSKRLKTLERAGIVERVRAADGRGGEYVLTDAGRELEPVIVAIGEWGARWVRADLLAAENLDASLLMWDMRRCVVVESLPDRRVVVHFRLEGSTDARAHYWMVLDGDVDLCVVDPGHPVDLEVDGHVVTVAAIWLGHRSFADATASGELRVSGPPRLVRAFPHWFSLSRFARVPAPPG